MDNLKLQNRKSEKGFTLVELAVVMIIIGLLVGGILKGQELITNARVTTTASNIESLAAAFNGFRDKYNNAIPGDMNNAVARIAACAPIVACANGNANGQLPNVPGAAVAAGEQIGFFGQLLAGGFISNMDGTIAAGGFGTGNPTAPIGGGFTVGDRRAGAPTNLPGIMAGNINVVLTSALGALANNAGPLTNDQAFTIDAKIDDGSPVTGALLGDNNCDTGGAPNTYAFGVANGCSVSYQL